MGADEQPSRRTEWLAQRTHGGRHEIDCIVETSDGVIDIEAKLNATVADDDVKHLLWLRQQLGPDCHGLVVINTGPEAFRRRDGIAVVPLGLLRL